MPLPPPGTVKHVVIMVQENHTPDNYFGGLAPWGANVVANWPVEPKPAHRRSAPRPAALLPLAAPLRRLAAPPRQW